MVHNTVTTDEKLLTAQKCLYAYAHSGDSLWSELLGLRCYLNLQLSNCRPHCLYLISSEDH